MARNIVVEPIKFQSVREMRVELVERKGVGHPDYIADSASEAASRALCEYYLKEFGTILHHNLDKTLLVGGQANPRFGGGEVIEPVYIVVAGRATTEIKAGDRVEKVPFGSIIVKAVKKWIRENMRFLNPEEHVVVDYMVRKGSADLVAVFETGKQQIPLANDTSIGVGFYPLTPLEQLVLETERLLNSREYKSKMPAVGEDVKVMGLRKDKSIKLTVAAAFIDSQVKDIGEYLNYKQQVVEDILNLASKIVPDYNVEVNVNTADMPDKGIVYLTVTGTSAEHGDDGATGRGNRANGLITPMRPISLEATAGKNPVNHVGKIYNVLAEILARKIYDVSSDYVRDVYVEILSQIGKPIDNPQVVSIKVIPLDFSRSELPSNIVSEIEGIVNDELNSIKNITRMILESRVSLY
uniref:Methionine adenosyltransferase n=1 Tax=Thermogladius calderae TaxID=1200300 RepID=A0A7J3Y080_9CREN